MLFKASVSAVPLGSQPGFLGSPRVRLQSPYPWLRVWRVCCNLVSIIQVQMAGSGCPHRQPSPSTWRSLKARRKGEAGVWANTSRKSPLTLPTFNPPFLLHLPPSQINPNQGRCFFCWNLAKEKYIWDQTAFDSLPHLKVVHNKLVYSILLRQIIIQGAVEVFPCSQQGNWSLVRWSFYCLKNGKPWFCLSVFRKCGRWWLLSSRVFKPRWVDISLPMFCQWGFDMIYRHFTNYILTQSTVRMDDRVAGKDIHGQV